MAKQNPPRRAPRGEQRLATFRPLLDRLVFGLGLAGMLVTAHLYIQQQRGFDRGCLGFSDPGQASEGCAVVTQSGASTLFGVSNAIWGFLFYLFIVGLSVWLSRVGPPQRLGVKRLRAAAIAFGACYSAYLVYYQSAVVGTFCELCLTSASIVALLFVVTLIDFFTVPTPREAGTAPVEARRETPVLAGLAVAVLVLIGVDVAYFGSLEKGSGPAEINFDTSTISATGPGAAGAVQECGYDPEKSPVLDPAGLVNPMDPIKGNADASVTVVEYFDPNCPHCATLFPVMEEVAAKYGDRARFVYKPFVLWQQSVAQSAAMYAAAQEGKFFEMLAQQMMNQQPNGMSAEQLRGIASRIGMDPEVMMQRVNSGIYSSVLEMQQRQGREIGITSVPAVLVNGRFVAGHAKTAECLGRLIEAELPTP